MTRPLLSQVGSTPTPSPARCTSSCRACHAPRAARSPGCRATSAPCWRRRTRTGTTSATTTSRSSASSWRWRTRSASPRTRYSALLRAVRGNHRVTTPDPEQTYQALAKYGRDLTARRGATRASVDPVIGRDEEIRRVIQVLSRRTKNNPVLIGEPGVGKTAIVEGLAQRIVEGDVPEALKGKRVLALDLGSHGGRRQVPRRVRGAPEGGAQGSRDAEGEIILFIDELHTMVGRGRGGGGDGRRRDAQARCWRGASCAASAPPRSTSTASCIEKDAALERRFQPVFVGSRGWRTRSPSCAG